MVSCVRGTIMVHLPKGSSLRFIQMYGLGFRCIYLRSDDFGGFMCESYDSGALTWGMMIAVCAWRFRCIHLWGVGFRCIYLKSDDFGAFMCEGYDSGAFTCEMMISVHSCVRGRILFLGNDDFGAFMCEGYDVSAFARGTMFSVHSCLRSRISVHLLEGWWFRCIHVWGVRFRCIYMRDHDFGAFMCQG